MPRTWTIRSSAAELVSPVFVIPARRATLSRRGDPGAREANYSCLIDSLLTLPRTITFRESAEPRLPHFQTRGNDFFRWSLKGKTHVQRNWRLTNASRMIDDDSQKKIAPSSIRALSTNNCKNAERMNALYTKKKKKKKRINSEINREIRINLVNRYINRTI
jgi:hypothetical protein